MNIGRLAKSRGDLQTRLISTKKAPLSWKLRNIARWGFIRGWFANRVIAQLAQACGVCTITSELEVVHINGATGERTDYGVVSYRVVTDTGVAFMVDDFDVNTASATLDITTFRYHGLGTGAGAEAVGNTALTTESTTALNPDNTRQATSQSQPAANQYRTVGTLTFDADAAIIEHGLFSQAATGGGTLWDRSTFAAINVVGANGDSIQATYTLTVSSGG